jgi:hypothetical protein
MLVELHGQNYFANPKLTSSEPLREAVTSSAKKDVRSQGRFKRGVFDDETE